MAASFFQKLREDPATKELLGSLGGFASAKAGSLASGAITKMTAGDQTEKQERDGEEAEPDTAGKGALRGVMEAKEEGKSSLFGGIKGALKGLFKQGGSAKRPTNIYEQLFIGVPVAQAYENWTEYSKFPEFMKGPESVKVTKEEGEDGEEKETHQWTAKIFLNRRTWKATVEEDVENSRIRWSTEAAKGTIDGAISFTPIGDNATLMVYTLEYRPKGFFEWWGNRWRTVGRRARLDVKHFGRYVMMQDQSQDEDDEPEDGIDEDETPGEGPVVTTDEEEANDERDEQGEGPVEPTDEEGDPDAEGEVPEEQDDVDTADDEGEEDRDEGEEPGDEGEDEGEEVDNTPETPEEPEAPKAPAPVRSSRQRDPRAPRKPREPRS